MSSKLSVCREGCGRSVEYEIHQLCLTCYRRCRRNGVLFNQKHCKVQECEKGAFSNGYCGLHWNRWYVHGDPLFRKKRANGEGSIARGYLIYGRKDGKGHYREHRRVMERFLGRPLLDTEVVHHKDRNKLNNDPANLAVLDRRTHALLCGLENVFSLPKPEAQKLLDLVKEQFNYQIILE